MSDRGYICLQRGALEHEFFEREQYSEFEAWVWLLTEAAWKKRFRRVGDYTANLERGQLIASVRFLAEKWGWKKTKVERFLNRLKSETMIGTESGTGITIITICNYDKYQFGADAAGTDAGQITGQYRDSTGTDAGQMRDNTEEIKHSNIKAVEGAVAPDADVKSRKKPVRPMPDIFPASDAMQAYAEKRGYKFVIPRCFAFNKERPGPAQAMFEEFKNYHAAKDSRFADWDAAWRKWVDNQVRWDTERGKPPGLRPAI